MLRFCRLVTVLLLCLFCSETAYAARVNVNKIAAVVNGEAITMHELRLHTAMELARQRISQNDPRAATLQAELLDSMINDILLRQEAKRWNISVSKEDVEGEYQKTIARSGMPADKFVAEMKKQGMTPELAKNRLGNTLLRQRISHLMIVRKVFVTPEEVAAYFANNKEAFAGEKTVDFSIMTLPEKLKVQTIYGQLKSGAISFEETARKYSVDRTAQEGGRVRGVPWDRLPPDMHKLLTSLKPGGLSPLLRTQGGFAVIRLNSINEAKPLTLQEATPRIEEILRAPLLEERFKEYMGQLRGKAVIDIRI